MLFDENVRNVAFTSTADNVFGRLWDRVHRFASHARHLSVDSGISQIIGFQMYRFLLLSQNPHTELAPPFFWMLDVLPWDPLKLFDSDFDPLDSEPSLARVYAVIVLQPQIVAEEPDLTIYEKLVFVRYITETFFTTTDRLLKRARLEKWTSLKKDWAELNENLTVICFLTAHCNLRRQMLHRSHAAAGSVFLPNMFTNDSIEHSIQVLDSDINHSDIPTNELSARRRNIQMPLTIEIVGYEDIEQAFGTGRREHLREYAQHWLKKLGEGPSCYSEVILQIYDLNMLCRINTESRVRKTEKCTLETHQRQASIVFQEAAATLRRLTPPQVDAQEISHTITALSQYLDAIVETYTEQESEVFRNHRDFQWPRRLVHLLETEIANLRSQGHSDQPGKGRIVVAPEHNQEFTIGFSPRVAQDLDIFQDYYQSRIGFLDRLRELEDAIKVRESRAEEERLSLHTVFSLQQ